MSDTFDKIAAYIPINKQAALSASRGFEYEPSKQVITQEWTERPRMKRPVSHQEDLTGRQFGRLTVIGLLDAPATGKGPTWVCRCTCGRYTSRKAKSVKNTANKEDRCEQCRHVRFLRHTGDQIARAAIRSREDKP